jgi:hypothetical protein
VSALPNPIDELHDSLFGERPKKRGTRFERIAALVFAVLAEGTVRHQVLLRREARRARHWIDVQIEREQGTELAIVECKHWKQLVDQDVINSVVGRRQQLGAAEAIVVRTVGFTQGAIDVAYDEHVRLVRIHPLAVDEHWHGVVKEIRLRGSIAAPELIHVQWRAVDPAAVAELSAEGIDCVRGEDYDLETDRVEHEDGSRAESAAELMDRHPSPHENGEFSYEVALDGPRYLRIDDDRRIAVRSLEWTERVSVAEVSSVIGPRSPGRILVEEVTASDRQAKRVLMDHQLRVWQIDADGRLVQASGEPKPSS